MEVMPDTSREAKKAYYEMLAAKSFTERAMLTQALSRRTRLTSQAGIRLQNPEFSDEAVKREYLRRITTDEEFETLFPSS